MSSITLSASQMNGSKNEIMNKALLNNENLPPEPRKVALISGAGIAGLAASFVLNARGFEVFIVEKRKEFTRFNLINLNMEVQNFLRKFNLLNDFEAFAAARILEHKIIIFGREEVRTLPSSDVSELNFQDSLPKDFRFSNDLFAKEGIYSISIKDLQTFLAKKAAKLGVKILSEAEVKILSPIGEQISKVEIIQNSIPLFTLEPELFFIAEGAHSATVKNLNMNDEDKDEVYNLCTGENWIFANLKYSGARTFVTSMIDTSQKTLQIANLIFNAKNHVVNVAVTSEANMDKENIERLIINTAKKVFDQECIADELEPLDIIEKPVEITNRIASNCSSKNIFRIGDAVGHSSPLAGLGGTLGLTLVPCTIEHLLDDYFIGSEKLHDNFKELSQAYVNKWINKSKSIKEQLLDIFKQDNLPEANQLARRGSQ